MSGNSITRNWKPSEMDAANLAALRHLVMEIEQLGIAVFASDPDPDRPRLDMFIRTLTCHLVSLRKCARHSNDCEDCEIKAPQVSPDCAGGYDMCHDGLCYPAGSCSS